MMDRQSLHEYNLAKCSDGTPAAYYIDKDASNVAKNVMIYFDNSMDSFKSSIQPCISVDECVEVCEENPEACKSPIEVTKVQRDGLWSRERNNSPFADYFKVYLPSCTLDDFSGARGPLFGSNGGQIFFHGRHIFSSLLRDLVAKYGIDQAENVVLVGSGSGARGVGHSCDYLSEAIATVNEAASVKCVLDGPDLIPYWLNDDVAKDRCDTMEEDAFIEETTKELWGRTDDESCVRELENEVNETTLAVTCGMFSRYWKHIQTPMFIIASQWNQPDFDRITCDVAENDDDFSTYASAWRHGITTMIQVMSLQQPANGWFIPNCQDQTFFFADDAIEQRRNVNVPLFVNGGEMNVLQVLNNWLVKGITDDDYQAIDQFGPPDEACSSELQDQRSQPLKKKNKDDKSAKQRQRIVPLDPLDDVPHPKGFPDGPPPKPSEPIDDFLESDDFFLARDFFDYLRPRASNQRKSNKDRNKDNRRKGPNDVVDNLDLPLLPQGVSDSEIFLGSEMFRKEMAEQQRRRNRPGSNNRVDYYRNYDNDLLYYLTALSRGEGRGGSSTSNTKRYNYRNRFPVPNDLLYYRWNLFRQQTRPQTTTDAIFDPIDPSTPDFFDYDYDVNVNFGSGGTPTPPGVLPEQAVALANSRSRKARLWRKVYYLQYLRELYRRTYADYYNDYYYGITGSNSGNLVDPA